VKKDLSTVIQEAVEQTRRYLDKMGVEEGHVILFDQRTKEDKQLTELPQKETTAKRKAKSNENQVVLAPLLPWEERIKVSLSCIRNKTIKKKKVTVWCM
jgi:hypothetical protein